MLGKPGFASKSAIFSAVNNYVTTPRGLARDTWYVPHPNWLRACRSCTSMLTRPCPIGRELWTNLGDPFAFHSPSPNTWSPTDRSIGHKLKVSTLQSYNPTYYSINAYIFMANTTFNRSFLPPIFVVNLDLLSVLFTVTRKNLTKTLTALVPGGMRVSFCQHSVTIYPISRSYLVDNIYLPILWQNIDVKYAFHLWCIWAAQTASFGKFDCAIGNMSSGEYRWNDPKWRSYQYIFLQTRTRGTTINQHNCFSHVFCPQLIRNVRTLRRIDSSSIIAHLAAGKFR